MAVEGPSVKRDLVATTIVQVQATQSSSSQKRSERGQEVLTAR
jgi:hypothetical protein